MSTVKDPLAPELAPALSTRAPTGPGEARGGGVGVASTGPLEQAFRITLSGPDTALPLSVLLLALERLTTLEALPPELAAQLAAVRSQLLHPSLPPSEALARLTTFVTAYAERFVELREDGQETAPGANAAKDAFTSALRATGLDALRETTSGQSAPAFVRPLLDAPTPGVLREEAQRARWEIAPHPRGMLAALEEAARRHLLETTPWAARFVRGHLWNATSVSDARLNRIFWNAVALLIAAGLLWLWLRPLF